MKKNLTIRLFACLLFLLGAISAEAQLVTSGADDGGPGTLRSQIAAAAAGDVILIAPDVTDITLTAGQITIDKSLTLTGTALNQTSIDAAAASRIFELTAGTVTLGNLSLENGLADNGGAISITGADLILIGVSISGSVASAANGSGGAILVGAGASLTATNSEFTGNTANRAGGAIEVTAGTTVTLNSTDLSNNNAGVAPAVAAPGNGGALHVTGAGTVSITGGTVTMNRSAAEGGGLWNGAGTMTIDGTSITMNTASGAAADNGGGGIYNLNAGTLNISNAEISGNIADGAAGSGGGILNDVGSMLTVTASEISGNTSNRAGGGIENNAGTVTLTNVNIDNNTTFTSPGNGGGLHTTGIAGGMSISGGTISNNMAGSEGGGLWNGTGTTFIDGTTITMNRASGAAADNGGGGIYNLNAGTVNIMNAEISGNMADGAAGSGGGILNDVGATLYVMGSEVSGNTSNRAGGGIENNAGAVTLTNVNLDNNTTFASPGNGGGLHVTGVGTVNITGGTVSNNIAGSEGGGLWNGAGTMTIDGTTISTNTASGVAADQGGGGIYNFNGGGLTITNAFIQNNVANGTLGSGGGILNDVGSQLNVTATEISGNTAVRAGGGIEDNSGIPGVALTNVMLNGNSVSGPPGNGGGMHITGAGSATINGGTINDNTAALEGGGLWNGAGTMSLTDVAMSGNKAMGTAADDGGGAAFNNAGTLYIGNSQLSGNMAMGTSGSGGAVFCLAGLVTFTGGSVSNNAANRAGGAVEIVEGTLTFISCNVADNDVAGTAGLPNPGNGGAVHVTGAATVFVGNSVISGNNAQREGGGLWNQTGSTMTINLSTIDGNMASGPDALQGGGGIFNNGGDLAINNSTISNNNTMGALGNGGGLHVKAGTATIMTSTFSGNNSLNYGGGVYSNAALSVNAVTITANSATTGGGGIANISTTGGSLKNTIVANNTAPVGMDLFSTSAAFTSGGYNLVANDDAGAFINGATDIEGSDPLLGPLADNGGPTLTHAILTGSPAYNAGDPADEFLDQRAFPIFGGRRDIGAFEAQSVLANEAFASAPMSRSQIFPNPSVNGKINVRLAAGFNNRADGRLIELASGKTVLEFTAGQNINEINVQNFASGMYVLKLTGTDISENHKVIID